MIIHTVAAGRLVPREWRVEGVDYQSGDVYVATFSGPQAEARAKEYTGWKNAAEHEGAALRDRVGDN